jgi:hypothetical protein
MCVAGLYSFIIASGSAISRNDFAPGKDTPCQMMGEASANISGIFRTDRPYL